MSIDNIYYIIGFVAFVLIIRYFALKPMEKRIKENNKMMNEAQKYKLAEKEREKEVLRILEEKKENEKEVQEQKKSDETS